MSADREQVTDHGRAPYAGAHALLVDGPVGALVGGYGPEYDLVTPFRINSGRMEPAGGPRRLVLPDGLEVRRARMLCRGPELHVVVRGTWYRADLADLVG